MTSTGIGAMVLASGEGRRMRPLTNRMPKPMLPVLGLSLLDRALAKVEEVEPHRVVVGAHYRAELIMDSLRDRTDRVTVAVEDSLNGPAGSLRLYGGDPKLKALLVVSGDLLFTGSLSQLVDHHIQTEAAMTFGAQRMRGANRFGVLDTDSHGQLTSASEKPDVPLDEEYLVSAGIYCLSPHVLSLIPSDTRFDFAADLAPLLLEQGATVQTFQLNGFWSDVGTPRALYDANMAALRREQHVTPGPGRILTTGSGRTFLDDRVVLGSSVALEGNNAIIGPVHIEEEATLRDSVVIGESSIAQGQVLIGALVFDQGLHDPESGVQ